MNSVETNEKAVKIIAEAYGLDLSKPKMFELIVARIIAFYPDPNSTLLLVAHGGPIPDLKLDIPWEK
jgi:hypothetical protein